MRISDWSSDVCSSDLEKQPWLESDDEPVGWSEAKGDDSARTMKAIILEEAIARLASAESKRLREKVKWVLEKERTDISGIRVLQIGRASCRERVCQYV